jgi:hypothetical protein
MIRLICYELQGSSAYPQKTGSNHWIEKDAVNCASTQDVNRVVYRFYNVQLSFNLALQHLKDSAFEPRLPAPTHSMTVDTPRGTGENQIQLIAVKE